MSVIDSNPPDGAPAGAPERTPKKAALASFMGSAVEYYDFFVFGFVAALVFPKIFFPEGNETVALAQSFATLGVAYIARPVGAFVIGHFGDRIGRRNVLMFTLLLMGARPSRSAAYRRTRTVGALAPILLVAVPAAARLLGRGRAGRRQFAHP